MAGIYLHIPFCKSRCAYCGFYSCTRLDLRQRYVDAVCREMKLRRSYLHENVETVYLGGGTPSQLSASHLEQLFMAIGEAYSLSWTDEVTMECNPDDVTDDFATMLSHLPVNRVSMGAQTFSDDRLRFLSRRHTSEQVERAVNRLRHAGIGNISIDLMYGFPGESIQEWHHDIRQALALQVEHLSAYALMYEEGTPLFRMLEQGRVGELDEEVERQMYYDLIDSLDAAGYEHYEISNFAKRIAATASSRFTSYRSRHNSSYWNQTPYLGLGAAAHSYDGESRQWNVSDIERFIAGIEQGHPVFEREMLDAQTRYNDMIMTALRTSDGLRLDLLTPHQAEYCLQGAQRYLADGLLIRERDHLRLSRSGLFVSDMIMTDLMMV